MATTHETGDSPAGNGYRYDSFPVYNNALADELPHSHVSSPSKPSRARALAPDLLRGLLMILMAFDHTAVALRTWEHGTGRESEMDGIVIGSFNFTTAYVIRTLTHLCGSGFTFLLGMGVVYLGRSRKRLGWSPLRLVRYFFVRAVVLTIVNEVFGVLVTGGKVWFLNMVLFSLAVDYFLAGLLWQGLSSTEKVLTEALAKAMAAWSDDAQTEEESEDAENDVQQPLLHDPIDKKVRVMNRSSALSWHFHNVVLLALSVVTIFWNIWLSENNGHCRVESSDAAANFNSVVTDNDNAAAAASQNPFERIWFWPIMEGRVMSGFPPMAWLSFAILGLVYGRILTARNWSRRSLAVGHFSAAAVFLVIFVLTRIFRFGNLSEDCLQTPEHKQHPDKNPYLVSGASFFYLVKYPPDVAFWAFTTGANFLLLGIFDIVPVRITSRLTMLLDFGTTALFFYVTHLLVIFAISLPLVHFFGRDTGVPNPMDPSDSKGIDSLPWYFTQWALTLLLLWPICRAYSRFKSTKPADSLWRFF